MDLIEEKITIEDKLNVFGTSNFTKTATFKDLNGTAIKIDLGNIVTNGNIQSENFIEGETGWGINSETNTLFIDNIIVKDNINILNNSIKKSSGTNGSVLISNDFEIEKNQRIIYFTKDYCEQIDLSLTNINRVFNENNYYILVSDELNTHTTPDISEHPYATRDKQDPLGEEIPEFDFPTWGFKILDFDSFIHLFDPVLEDENENEEDTTNNDLHISLLDLFDENILQQIPYIKLFHPFQKDIEELIDNGDLINLEGLDILTSLIFQTVSVEKTLINEDGKYIYQDDAISNINLYYKYFGSNLEKGLNLYILTFTNNDLKLEIGNIIKCLKKLNNKSMTKLYNALIVGNVLGNYIVLLENSVSVPEQVNYIYDEEGNLTGSETKISDDFQIWSSEVIEKAKTLLQNYPNYKNESLAPEIIHYCILIILENEQLYYEDFLLDDTTTETTEEKIQIILELSREEISYEEILNNETFYKDFLNYTKVYPEIKDKLVKIGSIYSYQFEDSICITSEELGGAYLDILSGINRPDYNVSYLIPSEETYGEDYHVAQILNNSKVRIGDLSGIHDYNFKNHQPKSNGLYGRDVYLEGDFRLENGRSMKDIADDVDEIKSEIEHLDPDSNKCIPILQGKISLRQDDVRYYSEGGEIATSLLSYYDFDGISYLNLQEQSSIEEIGGLFINQNIFTSTPQKLNNVISEDELSNVGGLVNKIGEDVYLINACEISERSEEIMDDNLNESYRTYYYIDSTSDNKMHGKLLLGFGERWNTLFELHGFNIYINITGGYTKTYGDGDITPDEETTSYDEKPLTVQINIIKNELVSYQSYNSNTDKTIYESDVKFSYYAQLDLYEITGNRSNGDFYILIMLMPQNS